MYKETSNLIVYGNLEEDCILLSLAKLIKKVDNEKLVPWESLNRETRLKIYYKQIYRLLELSAEYGFSGNLWHCYIAYLLVTNENPYSLQVERKEYTEGTIGQIAKSDMERFFNILNYDFILLEQKMNVKCFQMIADYQVMVKNDSTYNTITYHKNVSDKINTLALELAKASGGEELFRIITRFYVRFGVGKFGCNKAFRVVHKAEDRIWIVPVGAAGSVTLDRLIGYGIQKKQLLENTEAFVSGRRANNCLLFGDSGTGKSTCVKAICNQYYERGLRLIEIYKHQFEDLAELIRQIRNRNYRFIIYMDDLSFEDFETGYKYLKAVIEGGLEEKPDNVLIYATSNRRHFIQETWSDRSDMRHENGIHQSDTMQEKLSLADRFGVTIHFAKPLKKEYEQIVLGLADANPEISLDNETLLANANAWSVRNGGYSGRIAEQFITYLLGGAEQNV